MATPWALSRSMAANSWDVSASVSAAVGSSRMSSLDSCESARARAVMVLPTGDSLSASCVTSMSWPRAAKSSRAARLRSPQRTTPNRDGVGRPRSTFSATERPPTVASSWNSVATPMVMAPCGEPKRSSCPPTATLPLSGTTTPEMILISVDLPAPFSPSSAWTSPAPDVKIDGIKHDCVAIGLG